MAYYLGQKVKSTNPRRITFTKILVVVVVATAVYFGVTFVPPYWRYSKAKEVIAESANKGYATRRQNDEVEEVLEKMRRRVIGALVESLKVTRRDLDVSVKQVKREITIEAKWTAYAKWPFISKRTSMKFKEDFVMPAR